MKRSLERSLQLEQRTKRWGRGCPTGPGRDLWFILIYLHIDINRDCFCIQEAWMTERLNRKIKVRSRILIELCFVAENCILLYFCKTP